MAKWRSLTPAAERASPGHKTGKLLTSQSLHTGRNGSSTNLATQSGRTKADFTQGRLHI